MDNKKPWLSKTMWTNVLAAAAIVWQGQTGEELPILSTEGQAVLLSFANIVLRSVTKTGIAIK
jgi:hypothetical protein